jgi:hypothetical protein
MADGRQFGRSSGRTRLIQFTPAAIDQRPSFPDNGLLPRSILTCFTYIVRLQFAGR